MIIAIPLRLTFIIGATLAVSSPVFAQDSSPAVKQKVEGAQKQVKTIGMEEYRKIVENPGSALIVDVREPHEYAAGQCLDQLIFLAASSRPKSGITSALQPTPKWTGLSSYNVKAADELHLPHNLSRTSDSRERRRSL